ncbi:hypothetical protein ACN3XK_72135 [Actinomadura welshii]
MALALRSSIHRLFPPSTRTSCWRKPNHLARVTIRDPQGRVRGAMSGEVGPHTLWSGNRTPAEIAQGVWKSVMASHTEARATRIAGTPWKHWVRGDDPLLGRVPAVPGDTY